MGTMNVKKRMYFLAQRLITKQLKKFHRSPLEKQFKIKRKLVILTIKRVQIFVRNVKFRKKLQIFRQRIPL